MTNPVSTTPTISLPPISQPFVDPTTGNIVLAWYQPLFGFYQRTGGQTGINIDSVNAKSDLAISTATSANAKASQALITANTAEGQATSALILANSATSQIATINGALLNTMLKSANLSDVVSASTSRTNLGLNTAQLSTMYDGMPSASQIKYIPLTRSFTIPANFLGTKTWAGTVPLANATFTVKIIRSGISTTVGTITIINGGNFTSMSCATTSVLAGDILEIDAPSAPDANMANISISILFNL